MIKGKIHMGIGFATGRTSFLNVLRAYIFHLRESHFLSKYNVLLSLYVAYDPAYQNTKKSDYDALTAEEREFFYECRFLGPEDIRQTLTAMIGEGVIDESEKDQLFGSGYAVQRNIIQFAALRGRVRLIPRFPPLINFAPFSGSTSRTLRSMRTFLSA